MTYQAGYLKWLQAAYTTEEWVDLVQVAHTNFASTLYFARSHEDVVYATNTYKACEMVISPWELTADTGASASITLSDPQGQLYFELMQIAENADDTVKATGPTVTWYRVKRTKDLSPLTELGISPADSLVCEGWAATKDGVELSLVPDMFPNKRAGVYYDDSEYEALPDF